MKPIIDHLQIAVRDLAVAESFYDKLLPVLGFDLNRKAKGRVAKHEFDVVEYIHPLLTIGFNSPRENFKDDIIIAENREHCITLRSKHHRAKKLMLFIY